MVPSALFFFKIVLAIQSFHPHFRIIFSSSVKNSIVIFIRIALYLYVALNNMVILTLFTLQICEHSIPFHLFAAFKILSLSLIFAILIIMCLGVDLFELI